MNVVVLIGTLSRDPESRDLPSGDTVTTFDLATRREVLPVGDLAAGARGRLDQHPMAVGHERVYAGRDQADAGFAVFDLLGNSNDHRCVLDPLQKEFRRFY